MTKNSRIEYIDNLRIFLTALVVLHHLSITYGASGGWYYKEVEGDTITTLLLTMFTASNQSFFMGMFFLISAYFTRLSMERKSVGAFLKDKLIRLGIPLIVYYFILSPLTSFMVVRYSRGVNIGFIEFVSTYQEFGFGPLWFVETLLIFSLVYAIVKWIFKRKKIKQQKASKFPKLQSIFLLALAIGTVSFVIRLWLPIGWELKHTGLQFPFFPQYIAMLILGVLIAKNNWLESITFKQGVRWVLFAQLFILIAFPFLFMFGMDDGIEAFLGGMTWQSACLSLWEQLTGLSLMIGLVGIFKQKFVTQSNLTKALSGSAYTVFIIHPVIIVPLSILFKEWDVYPILKFAILSPIALILCFGIAWLIKKAPYIKRVL